MAVGLGVAVAVGLGVGIGDGVAGPALLVTTVGLGVAVPAQATTATSRKKIEPIWARRPGRTLSSQSSMSQSNNGCPRPLIHRAAAVAMDIACFKVIRA
jgi:hypothetical protein